MRYISLFSGVEACSVAWHDLGWTPVAFADFEAFPSAVLEHHYPTVPNLHDVTEVDWSDYKGQADLIVGGSPCQSFSQAGTRLGLGDARGNLALHFLRVVEAVEPKWFIYENVAGLLSSDGGRDFATFLSSVADIGYGFAYRVLDAQHFGVAQRRRRVFVIGCAGGDWRSPSAVLFDSTSMRGTHTASRPSGSGYRPTTTGGFDESSGFASELGDRDSAVVPSKGMEGGICDEGWRGRVKGVDRPNQTLTHDVSPTLRAGHVAIPCAMVDCPPFVPAADPLLPVVRRLTPVECERLQGFPDDYTLVPFKGRMAKNGPRWKAVGNSMAVPVMRWLGEGVDFVEKLGTVPDLKDQEGVLVSIHDDVTLRSHDLTSWFD